MKNAFLKPNLVDAKFFRLRNMCSAYIDRIDKTYSTAASLWCPIFWAPVGANMFNLPKFATD